MVEADIVSYGVISGMCMECFESTICRNDNNLGNYMLNMDILEAGANKLGINLATRHIDQFGLYYHEILDGNRRTNLTRITDFEEMQGLHFVDSLSVVAGLPGRMIYPNTTVIDIGSGAGLPGIPLKIAFPDIHLTLVESNGKKAEFLEHVIESLGIGDTIVVCSRAETAAHISGLRESFDLVVSRAVARLDILAELTLPFCRVGRLAIAQKGDNVHDEVKSAASAIEALGGGEVTITEIDLSYSDSIRTLVSIEKIEQTIDNLPRRPGMPAKRPL